MPPKSQKDLDPSTLIIKIISFASISQRNPICVQASIGAINAWFAWARATKSSENYNAGTTFASTALLNGGEIIRPALIVERKSCSSGLKMTNYSTSVICHPKRRMKMLSLDVFVRFAGERSIKGRRWIFVRFVEVFTGTLDVCLIKVWVGTAVTVGTNSLSMRRRRENDGLRMVILMMIW